MNIYWQYWLQVGLVASGYRMDERKIHSIVVKSWFNDYNIYDRRYQYPKPITDKATLGASAVGVYQFTFSAESPKYLFASQAWWYGIKKNKTLFHGRDGSTNLVSIVPNNERRKILHKIKITCDKNIEDIHRQALEFSTLRVKRSIHLHLDSSDKNGLMESKPSYESVGFRNYTDDLSGSNNPEICSNDLQLVDKGVFFQNDVVLENLNYDLGVDDLILIQKIALDGIYDDNTTTSSLVFTRNSIGHVQRIYFGVATKQYALYNIVVDYSYRHM